MCRFLFPGRLVRKNSSKSIHEVAQGGEDARFGDLASILAEGCCCSDGLGWEKKHGDDVFDVYINGWSHNLA